ncbi:MAG TPA: TRAP transporter small permease [Burkholderiaceae bacterium]|nr:TRAP transporter small permease [Burkholderiaceae bacterium]
MDPGPVGKAFESASRALALIGGVILAVIAAVATYSILARWLFAQPLIGDVELVQIGVTMAVALFLPWCQWRRGHILVDFFTSRASERTRARLDALGAFLLAAVFLLLAWRVAIGVADMKANGETSMLLGFPTWITYLLLVPCLILSGINGLYTALRTLRSGGDRPPLETDHA